MTSAQGDGGGWGGGSARVHSSEDDCQKQQWCSSLPLLPGEGCSNGFRSLYCMDACVVHTEAMTHEKERSSWFKTKNTTRTNRLNPGLKSK